MKYNIVKDTTFLYKNIKSILARVFNLLKENKINMVEIQCDTKIDKRRK